MAPLLALLILVTLHFTEAQRSPPSSTDDGDFETPYGSNFNPVTAILIVVLVTAFFFLGFFSVYIRRCYGGRSAISPAAAGVAGAAATSRRGGAGRRGLDPAVIETFPILSYSAVTGLKIRKESLECAVCLSEFSEGENLRLLPKCCHVFHPECIDTWLESHVTCPVCRSNLAVPGEGEGDVAIEVREGESEEEEVVEMPRSEPAAALDGGGDRDRFTLRLPENLRREMEAAGMMRRSASVAAGRTRGEGSWRRGRGIWAGRSDRWAAAPGFLRTFSWRRREGEGSVKKGEAAAEGSSKGGMLHCLGGGEKSEYSGGEPV